MSSPRLGVVRPSMLTNPLHIKAPLGQSQSRGLTHPGPDFIYGTSKSQNDGGVAKMLSSWQVQSTRPHQSLTPDFVSLNRDAVKSGLVTSKELNQYRALMGETRTLGPPPKQQQASRRPAVPDITFGVTSRQTTSFADIISHRYGQRWVEEQLSRDQTNNNNNKQPQRTRAGFIHDTRTSILRRSRPLPVTQTPFTLPRFTQVAPALDTFRDQEARLRAFRARPSDCVQERRLGSGLVQPGLKRSTLIQIEKAS